MDRERGSGSYLSPGEVGERGSEERGSEERGGEMRDGVSTRWNLANLAEKEVS